MIEQNGDFYLFEGQMYYSKDIQKKVEKVMLVAHSDNKLVLETSISKQQIVHEHFNHLDFKTVTQAHKQLHFMEAITDGEKNL